MMIKEKISPPPSLAGGASVSSGDNPSSLKLLTYHYANQLYRWIARNGWAGWDPYDLWDNPAGVWMMSGSSFFSRAGGYITGHIEVISPILLRRVFGAKQQVNPKAMGLFAASFLDIEASQGQALLMNDVPAYVTCFQWLDENRVTRFGGCGWGYPFDWRSRVLIPRNTPTVVNSTIIGDAYWLLYKYHNDKRALSRCEEICQFITNGLNRSISGPDGSFCFSYTPVDKFQVHNANLFGAEFLIRIGRETGREDWVATGIAAAKFSLSDIRNDGTLAYWSEEQSRDGLQQDTYHSGFEIRALDGIARVTGDITFRKAADDYFAIWLRDFFSTSGAPCFMRGKFDVIEVHSCAESLLCAVRMFESGTFPEPAFRKHVNNVLASALSALWIQQDDNRGYFAWMNKKRLGIPCKTNIPLVRWGEAWMFRALTAVLKSV